MGMPVANGGWLMAAIFNVEIAITASLQAMSLHG